jgi:hypothetical protein
MVKTNSLINTRVRIEYYDQNERMASILPRRGVIIRQLQAENNVDGWFLVQLDDPFDYQIKIAEPFTFRILNCDRILIRSRWHGQQVGEAEPTSVFILLVLDETSLKEEPIRVKQFYHVAWGMCHTET